MKRAPSNMVAADTARGEQIAGMRYSRNSFHAANSERAVFRLDLWRGMKMHRRTALGIVLAGVLLTAAYLFQFWPVYTAEALIFIEPLPVPAVTGDSGAVAHWPESYSAAAYDSYVQQQMLMMTRADVLQGAVGKLPNFLKSGESRQDAAERLARAIRVARKGQSYAVSIEAQAGNAQASADMANAVANSYIESALREQRTGDAARLNVMRAEVERAGKELDAARADLVALNARSGAATKLPRAGDLAMEIAHLQNRYDALDEQLQNLQVGNAWRETARVALAAVAPAHPVLDGVVRNAAVLLVAFLLLAIAAAVVASKIDPRIYVASDIEQALGFAPLAQLADTDDVSRNTFEEQLMQLAVAVENALKRSGLKSCVFTGTGPGTGVSTVAGRVRTRLESVNRPAVLVDALGVRPAVWPAGQDHEAAESSETRPLIQIKQLADEARVKNGTVVLADAAPLTVSAETEYLACHMDGVIVVIESGVTTRAELRATAGVLRQLDVGAVGYVLNRVRLAKADGGFRRSMRAMENHVRRQRHRREPEEVRTRRVSAEPVLVPQTAPEPAPEVEERRAHSEEPVAPQPAAAVAAEPSAPQTPSAPAAQEKREPDLSWWAADPLLHPNRPTRSPDKWWSEAAPAAGREVSAQESRFSSLRKLFADKAAGTANEMAKPSSAEASAPMAENTAKPPLKGIEFGAQASTAVRREAAAKSVPVGGRRATSEITTVPEILPPRETRDVSRDDEAAGRRDRRDTWDGVAVLPSWRGQYRRKE